ncbi:MAG: efflux RND transporter periplasmic adaptor subunit [Bacteroidetes bacterium]|nr:efflux RND transporter periplasmic adaptor subunit [Bacteroidota bacterium]
MLSRKKRILSLLLIIVTASSILLLFGCAKEEKKEAKSMEKIREEQGVPVKIEVVQPTRFDKKLSFFSKLSGIEESTKFSTVADRIVSVRAKVGQSVGEGKVVMTFPTDNPELQFSQAKIGLENAEKLYKRMSELLKAGETAQQNFDNAETQYLVSKRNYESLKQMLFVESPISGTIVEMFVKPGDDVFRDVKLFTVAKLQTMKAKIWVSESEVNQLKNGMSATIEFGGKEYKGKVSEISLAMDDMKRAFGVEIQFPNPKRELKSGVTTDVKIITYTNPNVIVVPRNLIKSEGNKNYVFVENGGKAEQRFIQTGNESSISVEVLNGLNAGDRLISEGLSLLASGKKIKVIQ